MKISLYGKQYVLIAKQDVDEFGNPGHWVTTKRKKRFFIPDGVENVEKYLKNHFEAYNIGDKSYTDLSPEAKPQRIQEVVKRFVFAGLTTSITSNNKKLNTYELRHEAHQFWKKNLPEFINNDELKAEITELVKTYGSEIESKWRKRMISKLETHNTKVKVHKRVPLYKLNDVVDGWKDLPDHVKKRTEKLEAVAINSQSADSGGWWYPAERKIKLDFGLSGANPEKMKVFMRGVLHHEGAHAKWYSYPKELREEFANRLMDEGITSISTYNEGYYKKWQAYKKRYEKNSDDTELKWKMELTERLHFNEMHSETVARWAMKEFKHGEEPIRGDGKPESGHEWNDEAAEKSWKIINEVFGDYYKKSYLAEAKTAGERVQNEDGVWGHWITARGTKVFVEDGQDPGDAIEKKFGDKKSDDKIKGYEEREKQRTIKHREKIKSNSEELAEKIEFNKENTSMTRAGRITDAALDVGNYLGRIEYAMGQSEIPELLGDVQHEGTDVEYHADIKSSVFYERMLSMVPNSVPEIEPFRKVVVELENEGKELYDEYYENAKSFHRGLGVDEVFYMLESGEMRSESFGYLCTTTKKRYAMDFITSSDARIAFTKNERLEKHLVKQGFSLAQIEPVNTSKDPNVPERLAKINSAEFRVKEGTKTADVDMVITLYDSRNVSKIKKMIKEKGYDNITVVQKNYDDDYEGNLVAAATKMPAMFKMMTKIGHSENKTDEEIRESIRQEYKRWTGKEYQGDIDIPKTASIADKLANALGMMTETVKQHKLKQAKFTVLGKTYLLTAADGEDVVDGKKGKWVTVNGTRVFIEDGQDFDEALEKAIGKPVEDKAKEEFAKLDKDKKYKAESEKITKTLNSKLKVVEKSKLSFYVYEEKEVKDMYSVTNHLRTMWSDFHDFVIDVGKDNVPKHYYDSLFSANQEGLTNIRDLKENSIPELEPMRKFLIKTDKKIEKEMEENYQAAPVVYRGTGDRQIIELFTKGTLTGTRRGFNEFSTSPQVANKFGKGIRLTMKNDEAMKKAMVRQSYTITHANDSLGSDGPKATQGIVFIREREIRLPNLSKEDFAKLSIQSIEFTDRASYENVLGGLDPEQMEAFENDSRVVKNW